MKVGDKRVICFNRKNSFDYVSLKIIKNMTGIGEFSGKPIKGFLAEGSDSYLYGYNYPIAGEGFFSGSTWTRYRLIKYKNRTFEELSDQEKDRLIDKFIWRDVSIIEFRNKPIELLRKYSFLNYCKKHSLVYYGRYCQRCSAQNRQNWNQK